MLKYIFKRILSSIVVLLGVVTITFFIARVIPSNPEVKWAGQRATPEQKQHKIDLVDYLFENPYHSSLKTT